MMSSNAGKNTAGSAVRTVCVILVDRANYGRLKPVMQAIKEHPGLRLQVLVAGTMVLERFHQPVNVVRADGFEISGEIYTELEGSKPVTMAKSVGFGVVEFSSELQRLQPDLVLLIGDRYEALSAAIAAAYMNLPVIHLQGGESSGSIDESARHAITKFAQFHVPSTNLAAENIIRMGERADTILTIGCPSSDIARCLDRTITADMLNSQGAGAEIDPSQPFLTVVFHPTTTEFGNEQEQMESLLLALEKFKIPTVLLWPNIDAGSDHIGKTIRVFRDRHRAGNWLRTRTNFTPDDYLRVLANTACAIGNSSSFVRDAGYFGAPVVLVGDRQAGREAGKHVTRVVCDAELIELAISAQLKHGRYEPCTIYGDGHVAPRIADAARELTPYLQKRLSYDVAAN